MTTDVTPASVRCPTFSLVLCTVGDKGDLRRVLHSLVAQTFSNFEVIVVDQNEHHRLDAIVADYADRLNLTHVRNGRGLSRSRNRGIEGAEAQIIGFPDDDCWYEANFLERMASLFTEREDCIGVTGLCLDGDGRPAAGGGLRRPVELTKRNAWHCGVSTTMFLRRSAFDLVGGFDEGLGLGAATPYQSGEETDLLLRLIAAGERVIYCPDLVVRHPRSRLKGPRARERARVYGVGMGRVLRSHAFPAAEALGHLARPVLGAIVAGCTFRPDLAWIRWARATGRWRGYFLSYHDTGRGMRSPLRSEGGSATPLKRTNRLRRASDADCR
jgi:GT2 family glycosyltransferase